MSKSRVDAPTEEQLAARINDERYTVSRILITKEMFDRLVNVVATHSHRDGKFRTYKLSIVEGLDSLIRFTVYERFFALKTYRADQHRGPMAFFIRFSSEEWRLLSETRRLLLEQSEKKLTTQDVIVLAILAAAQTIIVTRP